jgi:geranylgeranyl diphosphate synthase type II
MTDVKTLLQSGAALTDAALERLLPSATTPPHSIHRAMRHSTFAGGKRLRPILCMEAARMVAGTVPEGAADLGAALEMVHTYSLIHDDLPALDNDDLRRGQPTCHVVFGEAIAILAGDALQTLAFQTIAQLPAPPSTIVAILHDFALAIGTGVGPLSEAQTATLPPGMIGGQVVDIESEGHPPTAALVEQIHRAKTGALITTSIVTGGLLGLAHHVTSKSSTPSSPLLGTSSPLLGTSSPLLGTSSPLLGTGFSPSGATHETNRALAPEAMHTDTIASLRTFGEKAGLAFQIIDDILDVTQTSAELGKTAGKDTASIKATWPAVFGLDQSRHDAAELIADAFAALAPFGDAGTPLKLLAEYLTTRTN